MGKYDTDASVIRVQGEMTIYRAHELMQELIPAVGNTSRHAVLDLSQVTELDTAGLQILLMAHRTAMARGMRLAVTHPSECVSEVLDLCNLSALLRDDDHSAAET